MTQLNLVELANQLQSYSIPPRPAFLIGIEQAISEPDPDLNKIAELVSQDIGVGGFALQVVNSPLFGLPVKVHSVAQAIRFLGLNRSIKLVRSVALRFSLSKEPPPKFELNIWHSSQITAQSCLLLARRQQWISEDDAYSLGLFHNAGMILMRHHFKDYPSVIKKAYQDINLCISAYEREQLDVSHAVLGALLADSWGLGHTLSQVIGLHHEERCVLEQLPLTLARPLALLKAAEFISQQSHFLAECDDHEWAEVEDWVLTLLEMNDGDMMEIEDAIESMMNETPF